MSGPVCDHCKQPLHADRNGWWVGEDETSDCPSSLEDGHEVDGYPRDREPGEL